jgi:uncharacterized damage-inducible protein DinB
MEFQCEQAVEVLSRTPVVLESLFRGLSEPWIRQNEGAESWSPFEVLGHLVSVEEVAWIPRARSILERGESQAFEPIDRVAQRERFKDETVASLLDAFARWRRQNLEALKQMNLTPARLALKGTHPEFGPVTLGELLSTWVVHDLDHLGQIVRVMSKQYTDAVGPWRAFLPILTRY